jgi:hypothetical protein
LSGPRETSSKCKWAMVAKGFGSETMVVVFSLQVRTRRISRGRKRNRKEDEQHDSTSEKRTVDGEGFVFATFAADVELVASVLLKREGRKG